LGNLYAFTPNGDVKWVCPAPSQDNTPSIGSDGTIYIGGYPSTLYAYDPNGSNCVEKWHFTTDESQYNYSTIEVPPAIDSNGNIYFSTAVPYGYINMDSAIYAAKPDGSLIWRFPVHWRNNNPALVLAPITMDKNNNIFTCSDNGSCYAIAQDGTLLWESMIEPWGFMRSTPYIYADGKMVVIGPKGLYRFEVISDQLYLPLISKLDTQ
jgi:outer membrane protein assembly factor BamB